MGTKTVLENLQLQIAEYSATPLFAVHLSATSNKLTLAFNFRLVEIINQAKV